jgi:hypothetical protein
MRKLTVLLAAVLSLATAASAQQTIPAPGEMVTRVVERPSDAALEEYIEEQRKTAPGFIDRFAGPVGENLKIHMVASRGLMGTLGAAWVPDAKVVTVDVSVKLAKGGSTTIKTTNIRANTLVIPDPVGESPPLAHATLTADVLRDRIIEADVFVTIDGESVLLQNVRLRSGESQDVKAASGDTFTLTATVRDMTERERSASEQMRADSVARQIRERNDWDAANPGRPFQYPSGGGRRFTPEELEARRRPRSAEEDAFVASTPSDIPDGYVVEASETLTFAGGEEISSLNGLGLDDQFQMDLVNLPSGKKYSGSTRYRASADGTIMVQKIFLLDGQVIAQPGLSARSGEPVGTSVDGLTYKAIFTLRKMTLNEKRVYDQYMTANKRVPDPDTLPPGVDPRPRRAASVSRALPRVVPLLATGGQAVSRLMPRMSDEEQDRRRKEEMEEFRASPPPGMTQAQIDDRLRNPPAPTKLDRARMVMHEYSWQLSQHMPSRTLPDGKLLETSMWVQLPGGEQLGPFRMYNSSPLHSDSLESADGMFGADGNERFVGTMLGTASADETVEMTFALVIDRQPLMVAGARARSGEAAAYTTEGGYHLTVRPVLRAPTWQEQRNIEARSNAHIHQSIATRLRGPPEPPPVVSALPAPTPIP